MNTPAVTTTPTVMTPLDRFLGVMEYQPVDRVPNWEAGVWGATVTRWQSEGLDSESLHWNWFPGEASLGMDVREFIPFHRTMMPAIEFQILDEDEQTRVFRDTLGRVRREFKPGSANAGMAMDTYLRFPVENMGDWRAMKKRYELRPERRYECNWRTMRPAGWRTRQHPLILGRNCDTAGFYWMAREWMGTENLSFAWYDQPDMMHDMMEFWADFLIESARPVLEQATVEYVCINEDLSMKTGPLLSPKTYEQFILPRLVRLIAFYKSHGVRYICIDTDGNPEVLIAMMLDAGVDAIWPMERAADQDPIRLRKTFGKSLRLWGGVDKRELAKGPDAIDAHLRTLQPLIEEGGFIPTVDHTIPPDVSWADFQHYMRSKGKLLEGRL
ncbi:MAG: uroporphyrinogen decarboxylase family protein [Phycisphaerales bacterium]